MHPTRPPAPLRPPPQCVASASFGCDTGKPSTSCCDTTNYFCALKVDPYTGDTAFCKKLA